MRLSRPAFQSSMAAASLMARTLRHRFFLEQRMDTSNFTGLTWQVAAPPQWGHGIKSRRMPAVIVIALAIVVLS